MALRLRRRLAALLMRVNVRVWAMIERLDPLEMDVGPALAAGECPVCRRPMPWARKRRRRDD